MATLLKIYGLIILLAIIAAGADRFIFKKKEDLLVRICIYFAAFYWVIASVRTLSGSGYDYMTFSFYGKGGRGYLKVALLLLAVYGINSLAGHFLKEKYDSFLKLWAAYFAGLASLYIVIKDQLQMRIGLVCGIIAALGAILSLLLKLVKDIDDMKERKLLTLSQLFLFAILYYIVGPLELYAYNADDFIFGLGDFYPLLIVGSLIFVLPVSKLVNEYMPEAVYKIYILILTAYNVIGYIQAFLLNGRMTALDGSEQVWSSAKLIVNGLIWLILAAVLIITAFKTKKWKKIFTYAAAYIIAIQLLTMIYIFITTDATGARTMQVTEKGSFTVSSDENMVIFLLDAYDTQFIDKVLADKPDYLEPLKDFTYYNNMESRYYYTDFSLPFLLTGPVNKKLDVEDKAETEDWFKGSDFLSKIKDKGFDLNILTERKYVKNIEEGLVSNYTDDGYCLLDAEKTMAIFSNCMRYKNMPFALKKLYRYEIFDLSNTITETNIYKMGTDDLIDKYIKENGLEVSDDYKAFRFFHLYGAHAPYYVTENNEMDYNSCNPLAQFKGCLLTVYDYIDALKAAGLYDNTTIIIMADHGLNPGQVDALKSAGETCDENKSNPIFFIKEKNADREEMLVDSKPTSHDLFFDTVMQSIDSSASDEYFGNIWE